MKQNSSVRVVVQILHPMRHRGHSTVGDTGRNTHRHHATTMSEPATLENTVVIANVRGQDC